MGTSYYTVIVYGVKETPEMREARGITVKSSRRACAKDPHHPVAHGTKFCGRCGGEIVWREIERHGYEDPVKTYMPAGMSYANERDVDTVLNDWVHTTGNEAEPGVALGVQLHYEWAGEHEVHVPVASQDQHLAAVAYLKHLGIEAEPTVCVVVGGS